MSKNIPTTKISIIIPVFNSSLFIDKCIDSISRQNYSNLEVIIVNDGSTDDSLSKCIKWQKKDKRIKIISTQNNGQGIARNIGVKVCSGDYVLFVDSDDWLEENAITALYDLFDTKQYDIICFANDSSPTQNNGSLKVFEQPLLMYEHLLSHQGTGHSPCDKLIKRNLLIKYPFPPIKAYEDASIIYKIFSEVDRIVFVDKVLYHYTQHDNSVMHHHFSQTNFLSIKVYYDMYQFYLERYNNYSKYVKRILIGAIQFCVGEYGLVSKKDAIISNFKETIELVKKINYSSLSIKNRVCLFLIKHHIKIYWYLYKKKHKNQRTLEQQ